jgi:hypothetical protein
VEQLGANGVDTVVCVPDSQQRSLLEALAADPRFRLLTAATEDEAVGIASGFYFGGRLGHNSSSNQVVQGDNYTRMTNYIAATLNAGMGIYVGRLQTPDVRQNAKATLDNYLFNLQQQGKIGTADGSQAFQVVLDDSNNPPARVALGYMQADVRVTYLSVIEKFIVNIEGGQSVQIQRQGLTPIN